MTALLLVTLLLTYALPVYAAEGSESQYSTIFGEDYISYANYELTSLSRSPNLGLSMDGLSISQPYVLLNDNDETNVAFFLFQSNRCIGELAVSRYYGKFFSSFIYEDIPAVTAAYISSTPICFASTGYSLLMCSENEFQTVIGNVGYSELVYTGSLDESIAYAEKEPIVLLDVLPVEVPDTAALEPYKILDVPYVKNYTIDKEGICWAAVTASIIKYLKPEFGGLMR